MSRNKQTRTADPETAVGQLQALVREARLRLIAPTIENLDDCRARLEEAAGLLRQLQTGLPSGDPKRDANLRAPLGELRADIARVAALLESAAVFHNGWVRLAASMVAGYQADGNPAQPQSMPRVWLEV